ncbi:MAG: hypothetical protein M1836_002992 [Candelina mexicana]|nr:MAG: hypothetical protein M1836_002992 [Candelina mexicana]
MIPSLPLITPHDAHLLWYTPSTTNTTSPSFLEPTPTTTTTPTYSNPPPHPRRHAPHNNTTRSRLAHVQHSTHLLTQRKQNIRRFGSNWIRPPGVPKTYQAMMDEAAEREEQVAEAARELRLLEEQEAAEEEAAMEMGALEEGGEEAGGMGERDLDEDVPEAGEEEEEEGFSVEEEVGGDGVGDGDEGVLGEGGGDGVGGMGGEGEDRDLDEDVPEAGSYQHTDTEVEDESSQDGGEGSRGIEETRRVSAARSEGSSILLGSSVLGSSPGVGRQSSGPFARRLGGREN